MINITPQGPNDEPIITINGLPLITAGKIRAAQQAFEKTDAGAFRRVIQDHFSNLADDEIVTNDLLSILVDLVPGLGAIAAIVKVGEIFIPLLINNDPAKPPKPQDPDFPGIWNIQKALVSIGFNIKTDGLPGEETTNAIKKFQEQEGLTIDGLFGPITRAALLKKLSENWQKQHQ